MLGYKRVQHKNHFDEAHERVSHCKTDGGVKEENASKLELDIPEFENKGTKADVQALVSLAS